MLPRGYLALFIGGCALALSACGGGGSGSSGTPATLPATASPSPSPGPDIPLGAGQSFTYNGTMIATQLRLVPAPMPTATTVTTVVQNGTVKDGQTFNGVSSLYDVSVAESDATALKTTASQTDSYYALSSPAPSGAMSLLEYGSTWADENGNTLTYLYAAPQTLGQLPEVAGASWTNSPAMTVYENDATNANGAAFFSKIAYAQDGSYIETTTYPPGYGSNNGQSIITENADGSGSVTGAFGVGAVVFSSPKPESNGQYLIPYAIYASPNPGPTAQPLQSNTMGAWYTVPATLYHETDSDLGSQPVPGACNVPASVAATAMETQRTITRTDTILGYTDMQTVDAYRVPTLGAICLQMNDTQNSYYDYNGDEQFILTPSSSPTYVPTPYQTNTTTETLGLSNGAAPSSVSRRSASAASVAPLSTAAIEAARMQFEERVARTRAQRQFAFIKAFKAFMAKHNGGVR